MDEIMNSDLKHLRVSPPDSSPDCFHEVPVDCPEEVPVDVPPDRVHGKPVGVKMTKTLNFEQYGQTAFATFTSFWIC